MRDLIGSLERIEKAMSSCMLEVLTLFLSTVEAAATITSTEISITLWFM